MLCRHMEPTGHVKEGRICHYIPSCIEMEFAWLTGIYENSLGHLWWALAKNTYSSVFLSLLFSLLWVKRKLFVVKRLSQDKKDFESLSEDRPWLKSAALQRLSFWDWGMLWWSTNLMSPDLMSSGCRRGSARWAALLDKGNMIALLQMKIKMEVNVTLSVFSCQILSPTGLSFSW